jgi:hypothetical protein
MEHVETVRTHVSAQVWAMMQVHLHQLVRA